MSVENGGIYLLLGGNLGNVVDNLAKAEKICASFLRIEAKSSLYRSEPWGMESEHAFINQVWRISTNLEPHALLDRLLAAEQALGRERSTESGYQDRIIDMDILLFGSVVSNLSDLEIPHSRMHLRAFTLIPLLELDPSLEDPQNGKTYQSYLDELEEQEIKGLSKLED